MQCKRCGKELGNFTKCNFCGFENFSESGNVREMSRTEKNFYNGITIDAGGTEENNSGSRKNFRYGEQNFSPRMTFINFSGGGFFSRLFEKFVRGLMNDSLLTKIIAGLITIALVGIFFFFALPIMFFMFALGAGLFLYAKFTKKF